MTTLPDRFWAKVNKTDDCWVWTAYTNAAGYGRFMHCSRGHEYTPDNTSVLIGADGYRRRHCLACKRVIRAKVA